MDDVFSGVFFSPEGDLLEIPSDCEDEDGNDLSLTLSSAYISDDARHPKFAQFAVLGDGPSRRSYQQLQDILKAPSTPPQHPVKSEEIERESGAGREAMSVSPEATSASVPAGSGSMLPPLSKPMFPQAVVSAGADTGLLFGEVGTNLGVSIPGFEQQAVAGGLLREGGGGGNATTAAAPHTLLLQPKSEEPAEGGGGGSVVTAAAAAAEAAQAVALAAAAEAQAAQEMAVSKAAEAVKAVALHAQV